MSKGYHNLSKKASSDLAKLLAENDQVIVPMVELIETVRRSTVEAASIRARQAG